MKIRVVFLTFLFCVATVCALPDNLHHLAGRASRYGKFSLQVFDHRTTIKTPLHITRIGNKEGSPYHQGEISRINRRRYVVQYWGCWGKQDWSPPASTH